MNHRRLCWRLSWGGRPTAVVRSVVGAVAALVATLLLLGLFAAHHAERAAVERQLTTLLRPVASADDAAYLTRPTIDEAPDGEAIRVSYWFPITDLPAPGTSQTPGWYLSPALFERRTNSLDLQHRYPAAMRLDHRVVPYADDLIAVRVTTSSSGLEIPLSNVPFTSTAPRLDTRGFVLGGSAFVVLPAILLLRAASVVASGNLRSALAVLDRLGVNPARRRAIGAAVGVLGAIPGVVGAVTIAVTVLPRLEFIPLVGDPIFAGDLRVPSVGAVVISTAVLAAVAVVSGYSSRPGRDRRIADPVPRRPVRRRLVPAIVAAGALTVAPWLPADLDATVFSGGLLMAVLSLPIVMPLVLWHTGEVLVDGSRGRPVILTAGRSIQARAHDVAGPLVLLTVATALVPFAFAWVDSVETGTRSAEAPYWYRLPGSVWSQQRLDALGDEFDMTPAVLAIDGETGEPIGLIASCDSTRTVTMGDCGGDVRTPFGPANVVDSSTVDDPTMRGTAFLVAEGRDNESRLRASFLNADPPMGAVSLGIEDFDSPLKSWLLGGIMTLIAVTALGLALQAANSVSTSPYALARLSLIGLDTRRSRRHVAAQELLQLLTCAGTGLATGIAIIVLFARFDPAVSIDVAVILGVAGGAVAVACAVTGARVAAQRDPAGLWNDRRSTAW